MSAALLRIVASLLVGLAATSHAWAASTVTPLLHKACFSTSDRVSLCYSEHLLNDAEKPILLFIPGWTMPAAIWERQLDYFAGKRSVIAFDPRGQGESAAPPFGYTLDRRIRDIKELLDRFPNRSFVLVGWSLAVMESLAYVHRYGESRLDGLVLVDNSIGEGPDAPARKGKNPFFEELRSQREETLRKFTGAIFQTDPGAEMREKILTSSLKMRVEDSIRLLSWPKPRIFWKRTVHALSIPVLYLVTPRWGEQAIALTKKQPGATAKIFEHAGHALFWDEPDSFNNALESFVKSLKDRQP